MSLCAPVITREARAQQIREDEARTQFDLEKGPLLWVTLVRLDDEDHQLLVTLHHIIADGWSLNILIDEFSRLYAAACQGQALELPPLALQYGDYAAWQRRWLSGEVLQRQSDYWQQTLDGAPALLTLPTDRSMKSACLNNPTRSPL